MIASLIGAIVVAIGAIATAMFQKFNSVKKENTELKIKAVENVAKEVVAKKTDDELVDDFNSRYKPDGSSDGPR